MAGILDLNARDFAAALAELQLDPRRDAELRREYRRVNSPFAPIYGLIDRVRGSDASQGRVRANVVPMTRPQGMTGLEAIMSGEAELAVPNILLGAPEAAGMAVDAPAAAYQGAIPAEDMVGEALNTAGLLALGGQAIPAPAGSMRIFAGRNSRTADLEALARAQELSARRRSPEEIWNETGWFKGVDGQWRYEIPDNNLSIDAPTETYFTSGLTDIPEGLIRHQALADAYPDQSYLLRTNLISDPSQMSVENSQGSFSGSNGGLIELLNRGYDQTRSTAAHELQHFIQRNEGFSRGGNTINPPVVQTLLNRDLGSRVQDALMRAYNTGNRRRLEQLKSAYSDWEVDTWLNAFEEFPSSSYDEISRFVDGQVVYRQPDAANRTLTAENYLNNAGEVEARTVQRRLNLTPEERAARPPWLDEPVPRDQQIIPEEYLDYNLPDQNLLTANLRGLLAR